MTMTGGSSSGRRPAILARAGRLIASREAMTWYCMPGQIFPFHFISFHMEISDQACNTKLPIGRRPMGLSEGAGPPTPKGAVARLITTPYVIKLAETMHRLGEEC